MTLSTLVQIKEDHRAGRQCFGRAAGESRHVQGPHHCSHAGEGEVLLGKDHDGNMDRNEAQVAVKRSLEDFVVIQIQCDN